MHLITYKIHNKLYLSTFFSARKHFKSSLTSSIKLSSARFKNLSTVLAPSLTAIIFRLYKIISSHAMKFINSRPFSIAITFHNNYNTKYKHMPFAKISQQRLKISQKTIFNEIFFTDNWNTSQIKYNRFDQNRLLIEFPTINR